MRTDVRLPRTYSWYLGSELIAGSQLHTTHESTDASGVGQGSPAERLSLNIGWVSLPSPQEHLGWRLGGHAGLWHAALGDSRSRWALSPGLDISPMIRFGYVPSWQSDETVQTSFLLVPTFSLDTLYRIDRATQPSFALAPTFVLSVVINASSAVLP